MQKSLPFYAASIVAASAILSAGSYAEQNAEQPLASQIEETIVVSSRIEMPLRTVGSAVTVIDRETIEALGFTNAADILRTQSSIGVSNAGGPGQTTTLRIRGEEGFRTLLMIDGIEISDPSAPQTLPIFDHLLVNSIDRIEILRGPQGLIYGADAGGVINLISERGAKETEASFSVEGGSFGQQRLTGNIAGGNDSVDFSLSVEDSSNSGFSARNQTSDPLQEDDSYDNTTVHGRIGLRLTDALSVNLVVRTTEAEAEFDGCFVFDSVTFVSSNSNNCLSDFSQQAFRVSLEHDGQRFDHQLAFEYTDNSRDNFGDGSLSFGTDGVIQNVEYIGSAVLGGGHTLVGGIEVEEIQYQDNFGTDTDRGQDSVFVEYQGNLAEAFFYTVGARYDDNDDFGEHTSYRVSAAYPIELADGDFKIRGSYGNGFRAPSLFEIYNNINFAGLTDAGLSEEQSEGFDLGFDYVRESGLRVEFSYFNTEVEDEIQFSNTTFAYEQVSGTSEADGFELVFELPIGNSIRLNTNYTFTDTKTATGEARLRRPEHLANVSLLLDAMENKLTVGAHMRMSRDSFDQGFDNTGAILVPLDDYEVLSLTARYRVNPNIEIFARGENILDEDYEEVLGFNTSEAAAYAGVKLLF